MKPLEHKDLMQLAARAVQAKIPDCGFILLAFPTGKSKDDESRVNYISNVQREDAVKVMVEFLKKNGAEESWMKHL